MYFIWVVFWATLNFLKEMTKNKDLLQLMKFSAISFVMDEYFGYSIETLMNIRGESLIACYRTKNGANHGQLNRAEKKQFDKYFIEEMKKYRKQLAKWKAMTDALRQTFEGSKDSDHRKVVDFSIDLLHRTLDKFEVTADNDVISDTLKEHIFESLDRITTKSRTESEALRLKASFDNWLTVNKLI